MSANIFHLTNYDHTKLSDPPSVPRSNYHQLSSKTLFTSLLILSPLLCIVSILQIALSNEAIKRGPHEYIDASFFTEPEKWTERLGSYPAHLFAGQENLELASASLSLYRDWLKTLYTLRIALVVFLAINAVLSLAAFLYAFVAYGWSAHFDLAYALELVNGSFTYIYDKCTFDLGMWVCETKDLPHYDNGTLHTLCSLAAGARWTTLILFPLAFALFAFVWLDRLGDHRGYLVARHVELLNLCAESKAVRANY
ncbi:hypothetical protein E0Z10_g8010 [Xylaria hypoxylon]|uniref:Uncharacterized protein n=1 Tax=Xylaria hypoxylon TaxID=37992 RepID=A0A4Z0Y9B6_9PEZI|nr:hypothetical protein E0Z10_g8010 [Xylaria hypoxylon]